MAEAFLRQALFRHDPRPTARLREARHAFSVRGFRATTEAEFVDAFAKAVSERKPALIDCYMDIDEMVLPMVPAGKPIDELLLDA